MQGITWAIKSVIFNGGIFQIPHNKRMIKN